MITAVRYRIVKKYEQYSLEEYDLRFSTFITISADYPTLDDAYNILNTIISSQPPVNNSFPICYDYKGQII